MTHSTWSPHPGSGDWNTAGNWTPHEVPTEKATFGKSTQTTITFSRTGARIREIDLAHDADPYVFRFVASKEPALTIVHGVTNGSMHVATFVVAATATGYEDAQLQFVESATAGAANVAYHVGPVSDAGAGGGVLGFVDKSTAGSACFFVTTGKKAPGKDSTVGGEVSFGHEATAATARFFIDGSLGADGDTFGNVVFHQKSTAAQATFTNRGGTVKGGDGGNTQFYDDATAANGVFHNEGAMVAGANGGDVAFDGTANGASGRFHNYAGPAAGGFGGVTSFNNNPPEVPKGGASAGHGCYMNYGATGHFKGDGGHTELTAKHGSPTAGNGIFHNFGSEQSGDSTGGHTELSVSLPNPHGYFPTAGEATFHNYAARSASGAPGFTELAVYGEGSPGKAVPTAGNGVFINDGGTASRAAGGYTKLSGAATAANATLIAYGGTNGGHGGKVVFAGASSGGAATVKLHGNAELSIAYHQGGLTLGTLEVGGTAFVSTQVGTTTTTLTLASGLVLDGKVLTFAFTAGDGFKRHHAYAVLVAPKLKSRFTVAQFAGNAVHGAQPTFAFADDDTLTATF